MYFWIMRQNATNSDRLSERNENGRGFPKDKGTFCILASKYLHKTLNRALFNAVCNDGSPLFLNVLHFINYRTVYCTLSIETELKF